MGWLDAFVNPWLLGGLALAAAPIIIHLLNRRRFLVHEWAAMDFLFQASIINRRRLKFEDLLLLLMRMLIILLLVLAVARPLIKGFGEWHEDERVVILDDSFSMDVQASTGTVFDLGRESAINQVQDAVGRGIAVDVLLGSQPRAASLQVGGSSAGGGEGQELAETGWQLFQTLRELRAGDSALQLAQLIDRLVEDAGSRTAAYKRAVVLISDFRKVDWLEDGGKELTAPLKLALESVSARGLTRRLGFHFVDVGRYVRGNVAVTDLRVTSRHPLAGVPVSIQVEVTNASTNPLSQLEGHLEIASASSTDFRPSHRIPLPPFVSLAPKESASVEVNHIFETEGQYLLRATVDPDVLPRDNHNYSVIDVRKALNVLVVDGDPGEDRFAGESGYLMAALSPYGQLRSGIEARTLNGELIADDLESTDVVFILNKSELTEEERRLLERFLKNGGGVAFFLGNQVQGQAYRKLTRSSPDVDNETEVLFPAILREKQTIDTLTSLVPHSLDHPAFAVFRGMEGSPLERRLFSIYFEITPLPNSTVVATYDDAAKTPAILETAFGEGRVAVFNTSADRDWSNWPTDPSYIVLLQEWVGYLAPRRDSEYNLTVGDPIRWRVTPGTSYTVVTPTGVRQRLEVPEAAKTSPTLSYQKTGEAGFYRVEETPNLGPPGPTGIDPAVSVTRPRGTWYACRRPVAESQLEPLAESRLQELLEPLGVRFVLGRDIEIDAFEKEQEGELWRWLALGVGVFLVLELFAAWWFGSR